MEPVWKLCYKMNDLSFGKLMEVYAQSNLENGQEFWPEESRMRQIALSEQNFYNYLQQVFFKTPGACCCVLEKGNCYLSALRLEPYRDGLLLEALETAPDMRCRGYAKTLIRNMQKHTGSQKIYSHVGKRNLASLRTHESCGFRRISDFAVYADGSVNRRCFTLCYDPNL